MFAVQAGRSSGVAEDISRSFKASSRGKNQFYFFCLVNQHSDFDSNHSLNIWYYWNEIYNNCVLRFWVWWIVNIFQKMKHETSTVDSSNFQGTEEELFNPFSSSDHHLINSFLEFEKYALSLKLHELFPLASCQKVCYLLHCNFHFDISLYSLRNCTHG